MKILSIDDEPIFCSILRTALEQEGYHDTHFAHSGPSALKLIDSAPVPFDCFLVDIRMEPMDGIQLVHEIRRRAHCRHIPIIMLTALGEKDTIDEAFLAGADDYVTKPLDRVELKARLSMAHNIIQARAQARVLQDQIETSEQARTQKHVFTDAYILDEIDCLTSMTSVENYLLKLGSLRLKTISAIAFQVTNAQNMHKMLDGIEFADVMGDVALLLSQSLSASPHLLAYAGSGTFLAVTPQQSFLDQRTIQSGLNDSLEVLAGLYDQAELEVPRIFVGKPAKPYLLSLERPTRILERALGAVRDSAAETAVTVAA